MLIIFPRIQSEKRRNSEYGTIYALGIFAIAKKHRIHMMLAKGIQDRLRSMGYSIAASASSGKEAIRKVKRGASGSRVDGH